MRGRRNRLSNSVAMNHDAWPRARHLHERHSIALPRRKHSMEMQHQDGGDAQEPEITVFAPVYGCSAAHARRPLQLPLKAR